MQKARQRKRKMAEKLKQQIQTNTALVLAFWNLV
jgi:ribosomal protein L10